MVLAFLEVAPGVAPAATVPVDPIHIVVQNQGVDQDDPDVAAWSPDDSKILTVTSLGGTEVLLRDALTGAVISRIPTPPVPDGDIITVNSLDFSRDGDTAYAKAFDTRPADPGFCRLVTWIINLQSGRIVPAYQDTNGDACGELAPSAARLNGLLAVAHHGGLRLRDTMPDGSLNGLLVVDAGGKLVRTLQKPQGSLAALTLRDAALGADGHTLALIIGDDETESRIKRRPTTLGRIDLNNLQSMPDQPLPDRYTKVQWMDATRLLLTRSLVANDRNTSPSMTEDSTLDTPPPALVIDTASGTSTTLPMRCYAMPLPDGSLIGAGLPNCSAVAQSAGNGLQRTVNGQWQPFAPGIEGAGNYIDILALSADGSRLAVITSSSREQTDAHRLIVVDVASGGQVAALDLGSGPFAFDVALDRSGRKVVLCTDSSCRQWAPDLPAPPVEFAHSAIGEANGDRFVYGRGQVFDAFSGQSTITRFVPDDPARGSKLAIDRPLAMGFVPGKPQFWAASATDGIRLWDTRNWKQMQTITLFAKHHWLASMPDGRYDTDLSPDVRAFGWTVADQPERLLGPQTFMRTYFTPHLVERLQRCITVNNGCLAEFPKLPAPTDLNRVLPTVTIDAIKAVPGTDTAEVAVTVHEARDASAPPGKDRSGFYDLRLFRNGQLVAEYPAAAPEPVGQTIDQWRANTRIRFDQTDSQGLGVAHVRLTVALPSGPRSRLVRFRSYAFNADRIKSDNVDRRWLAPPAMPRPRRRFVLAIGIDHYDQPRLALHFAASDAQLMARRLAPAGDPLVHALVLDDHAGARVTKAVILAAIGLLGPGDHRRQRETLRAAGFDPAGFDTATPDDTVVVTWAGHGWADAQENFYLLGADAKWPDSDELPDTGSLISAADLADALKRVDAGDMAMVIDACHSAASVDTIAFKPGPMGDPGLGQLAWDKGVRILAAAARGDVAYESDIVGHGLLTAALAVHGLDDHGFGEADLNHDNNIMLDEWLRYALGEVPVLSQHVRANPTGTKLGHFTVISDSLAQPPRPQEPKLFDYTGSGSAVRLRRKTP